jgi:ribonuclease HI
MEIPHYASTASPIDTAFNSLGDSYTHQWTGSGVAFPLPTAEEAIKALKWALCSTFTDKPTLIALITPILPTSHGYHKFRSHPRVTSICTLPPATLILNNVDHVVGRECKPPYKARPMEILLVANLAGINQYLHPGSRTSPIHTRIQQMHHTISRYSKTNTEVSLNPETWQNLITHSPDTNPFRSTKFNNARQINLPSHLDRLPPPQRAAITASIVRQRTLRFAQTSLTYTDGSKQGSHIGAGVHIAHSQQYIVISLTGHNAALNTVNRAELAAIQAALTQPRPVTILTDSATSIHQIKNILENPMRFRIHNHKLLLVRIAHDMLHRAAQGHTTHIYKVRAHIGVAGNTIADAAAKLAAKPPDTANPHNPVLQNMQRVNQTMDHSTHQALGPTWYKVPDNTHEPHENTKLTTTADLKQGLNTHVSNHYQGTYIKQQTTGEKNKTLRKLLQVRAVLQLQQPPTDLLDPSISQIWRFTAFTNWERTLAMQIRYETAFTNSRKSMIQRGTQADAECILCGKVETLGHCLGGCTHTLMTQMYSKRHGNAVHRIATSIQLGNKGACPIFYDAEGHNRSARNLPSWLPPTQGASIPDIILVTGMTEEQVNDALHRHNIEEGQLFTAAEVFTPEERQAHLIEFTYTGDKWMAIKYHQKLQQHTTYITRMQEAGWQVRLTVIVVSHSGVATSTLQVCLKDLGVPQRHIDTVIATLAHNALRYARSIRRTRALLYTRTQQQHTQSNTQQDTTPAGDIQQHSSTLPHPLHQRRFKRIRTIYDPG